MSIKPTPEAVQHVFQLITGHIVASAVNIAARLGIADRLANGPRTSADLARECGVDEAALYRLLLRWPASGSLPKPRLAPST